MKLLKTLFLTTLLLVSVQICAENYPYRSDMLWVTVPDHANWLYELNQNPVVEIQVYQYGIPVEGNVTYSIGDDMLESFLHGNAKLVNGRTKIKMPGRKSPGFRDLRLEIKKDGKTYKHHIKVGFAVDRIRPVTKDPKDFDSFWRQNLEELKKVPLEYTKVPAPEYSTDKIECYLINLKVDQQGHSMYGYLFYPRNAQKGSCPVVLCPPGAGIKTIKNPLRHKYYAEQGMIRLEMEIHGLDPRLPQSTFNELSHAFNANGGYLADGIENPDRYYMKHVYCGMVRCIDLLTSLPEWDGRNVVVQGGSQGGALSIVTAALDSRVTLCAAHHPALSDMAGYSVKGATGGYPHFNRIPGFYTPSSLRTMALYDVVNFARRVKVPTFLTWGYNDVTCPPTTTYAVWNLLTCPKESLITPINEHWTSDDTDYKEMEWIKKRLR
ncbi:MAG: acetylxylan esterase [Prevotella sp.]|jgi:cephalosporin-C deacetylase-like acetyl esterase